MGLDIYTNSEGKVVVKGNAKLDTPDLELLIASLMCELSARLPLDDEELLLTDMDELSRKGEFKVSKKRKFKID